MPCHDYRSGKTRIETSSPCEFAIIDKWWVSLSHRISSPFPSRACTHILRLWGYYATAIYLGDASSSWRGEKKWNTQGLISIPCTRLNLRKELFIVENWELFPDHPAGDLLAKARIKSLRRRRQEQSYTFSNFASSHLPQ